MVFSGVTFLFYFLPLLLLAYFLTPSRFKNLTLLAGSIFFYQWGVPWFVFVILASTLLDFYVVRWMHSAKDPRKRKHLLVLSVSLNLGLLIWFKYANFFAGNIQYVQEILGFAPMKWTEVLLPIGISFYTFQTITYAVDVYRTKHEPLGKASDYLMYILMFPQLIAGPIVRFHEIADSIAERTHSLSKIEWGILRFALGLGKKVLVANVLGQTADEIFRMDPENIGTADAWIGILAYTFQIYFDFSGYSDMAIGLGLILGFRFPENFDNPYTSQSITEFWRRWHCTLGNFMRDYLYIPLGGNRRGKRRTYLNLLIVFLLSGLWHGAAWTFVAWGLFHGIFLLLDRLFLLQLFARLGKPFRVLFTFFVVVCGWVLFRSENLHFAQHYFTALFNYNPTGSLYRADAEFVFTLFLAVFFSIIVLSAKGRAIAGYIFPEQLDERPAAVLKICGIVLLVLSIIWLVAGNFNPFIYFRF